MTKILDAEHKLKGARLTLSKAQRRVERLHMELAEAIVAEGEADALWTAAEIALCELMEAKQAKEAEEAGRKERGTTWEDQVAEEAAVLLEYYGVGPDQY